MKERAIRIGVLSTVFILAMIGFSFWINRGSTDMTADMSEATLPTISFELGGRTVNTLVGHKREMNVVAMRDTITVCDEMGQLKAHIDNMGEETQVLRYELLTPDGKEKLQEKTIEGGKDTILLDLRNALGRDEERVLKITLSRGKSSLYYYTRVVKDNNFHVKECVDFVMGLHNDILLKQNTDDIRKVMESNAQGDNTTLQHVTIHSNLEHVLWGDLQPEVIGEVSMNLVETKAAYTSILLTYQVKCAGDNNEVEVYRVNEFFKVAQGTQRVYLIEYDRHLEEVFKPTNMVLSNKGVILGLADENISYKVNDAGTIVAFVQASELWSYNRKEDAFALVFSFGSSEKEDARNRTAKHSIQILSMEDSGNMTFSVCGYMNRGQHEGESGIAVYYYDQSQNCVEEEAFIPSIESALVIEQKVHELAYYNKEQDVLYVMTDGTLLKVDMQEMKQVVLMDSLRKGQYVASEDGHLLAYQKDVNGKLVTEIWDFAKDAKREVPAGAGEFVIPLGFLADDFVYGVSREENAGKDAAGTVIQAMHRVEIQNAAQEIVKTYEESGVYVLGATIQSNMITLKQGIKEGNSYRQTSEDYITSNETSANGQISLGTYWTDLKETQYRFVFAEGIKDKSAKTLKPKQLLQEIPTVLELENKDREAYFYVYGHGKQAGVFEEAGDAIRLADKISGVVISPKGHYAWEDGNRISWYRNFEISRFTPKEGESTLAACVRKILSYERSSADVASELANQSVEQVLSAHTGAEAIRFCGVSARDMCYLLDKKTPVIAMKGGNKALLLIGYDAQTVTYIDPSSGSIFTSTFEKVGEMTAGSGNTYIGYVK